ncbi:MAG: DUF2326 domain-containing protein [Candidatus Altiarchaeales archaeon HGW-Altiarchaeales-1]|nr:MAG: DUF2326 domain-containing protein [Candidatus Altiarchaeales archaeon HGW-Altiarchaeales-1]
MFLKYLKITKGSSVIRTINFRKGINLIVDESIGQITGNSVGKTTVLKLIDFCFGANKKIVWEDPENKKQEYTIVKNYLIENAILITLCLTENIDDKNAQKIVIERNFISRGKKVVRKINGDYFSEEEFEQKLKEIFYPEHQAEKPTLRQIISHNIRYKDLSLINTLRTLDRYTSDAEYETLHLFLLGCDFTKGSIKQEIIGKIKQEDIFKKRLEKDQTKSAYETTLSLIEREIEELNKKKSNLNINENFETDLDNLNNVKYTISKLSSEISKLNIRKDLILEAKKELESSKSNIDMQQLRQIYEQATSSLGKLQKSFEELVKYHNQMLSEKVKFITKELPQLESKIREKNNNLKSLLKEESILTSIISKSDTYEELEKLISEISQKNVLKGEYKNIIEQLNEVDNNLKEYHKRLSSINEELFSNEFENTIKMQCNKFNKHFASFSELLYDEKYALQYSIVPNSKGQQLYKFSTFVPYGPNVASGKKQGEISSFDIAYVFFADEENMPCMHFILNDKKELMHDNQLIKIAELANKSNIQFVASILKDKLPDELNKQEYFILELSEDNKLFKIEKG